MRNCKECKVNKSWFASIKIVMTSRKFFSVAVNFRAINSFCAYQSGLVERIR